MVADGQTVARLLREYAQRTALRGGNPYRAKAYSRAADSLSALRSLSMCSSTRVASPKSLAWEKLTPTLSQSCIGRARIQAWRSCARRSRRASLRS
ncbi:helix-hairpin-helix domain-containing protein [Bradyrhizobium sp. BWA-3-5]|nr:helix-hairpin-helix domain-containing protein [Bradyrhizobium sp. BWA-3-5]WOH67135.1 helix-hairpin-helix domain-containing protein [Bradyrhizobium sp. BWA-3-5]